MAVVRFVAGKRVHAFKGGEALILKKGRERSALQRHHWIFSGAVAELPECEGGAIVPVKATGGELLGHAYVNPKSTIVGRFVSFGDENPLDSVRMRMTESLALRRRWLSRRDPPVTNAFRLVNSEGDGLPGLIVDMYEDVAVLQSGTLGMDCLKGVVLEALCELVAPRSVLERSDAPARREEGLLPVEGLLFGEAVERTRIREGRLQLSVDFARGHKTGFFLDQREMRALAAEWASGRDCLDCFCNTGGFGLQMLASGARSAHFVDTAEGALAIARENAAQNDIAPDGKDGALRFTQADVFEFLRKDKDRYDFLVLDPPAFAKKKADVVAACRGYKDINRLAIGRVSPGGLVLTSSCSHFVDRRLFEQVIFQAALEARRTVRILSAHRLAPDHPISVYHPEGNYLKSLLLAVV